MRRRIPIIREIARERHAIDRILARSLRDRETLERIVARRRAYYEDRVRRGNVPSWHHDWFKRDQKRWQREFDRAHANRP